MRLLLRSATLAALGIGALACSGGTPSGACADNSDCQPGEACLGVRCAKLCQADRDCGDATAICVDSVCRTGTRNGLPVIDSVDGDGTLDGTSGHTHHRLGGHLLIQGTSFDGAAVELKDGLRSWPLDICDAATDRLEVALPDELRSNAGYRLVVLTQAGACEATLPVLQGEPGPAGADGADGAPGAEGPTGPAGLGFRGSWDFNEGAGNSALDTSGNSNHLTLSASGASWTTAGHGGAALLLDGTAGYAAAPDLPSLTPREEVTVSAWVYLTGNATGTNTIVAKEGQYALAVVNSQVKLAVQTAAGPGWAFQGSGAVPLNTWTAVAGSYDGFAIRTFVDGILTGYAAYPYGTLSSSTNALRVGARQSGTELFMGRIDDVRLLGYARGNDQPGLSTLVAMAGPGLIDWRNTSATSTAGVWVDVPERTVTFTKRFGPSRLKITYQDTLGTLGTFYAGCEWRILLDGAVVSNFSDSDEDKATSYWTMTNAAHIAWASGAAGAHTVKVQNRGNRGAWTTTTQCLQGWNTTGNFLSVEEIP